MGAWKARRAREEGGRVMRLSEKIVGTLRPNAVFFSRAPLVPLKVVCRGSVTKPRTPTLKGQGDPKVSQQF